MTLEDLKKIREDAQRAAKLREGEGSIKVIVHMGTTGIAAGAREVIAAFTLELSKRNITGVTVVQSGDFILESEEPAVTVVKPNEPKVTYGRMTPEKVSRILVEHILGERIIEEWVVAKEEE
ncbi:MAG: (2Fe-2S) ferredoxin domain-containing protein [Deltaproteobacteria bacterium]|nr:(2Fe-2S) ferredoxin domain-containing protein [Deltaproteobacteria bacterium]